MTTKRQLASPSNGYAPGATDTSARDGEDLSPAKKTLKTVVVKGRTAVDEACPVGKQCRVIDDATGAYDAALNQTNIGKNNNKVRAHTKARPWNGMPLWYTAPLTHVCVSPVHTFSIISFRLCSLTVALLSIVGRVGAEWAVKE